jgi:putative tricarboxylic transport membrane protein
MSTTAPSRSDLRSWLRGRSELGMALLLAAVGGFVIWDGSQLQSTYSETDPVGPKTMAYLVGSLLLVCAGLLASDVLRGGHGEAEEGEDIDLSHPTEWRVVVPLVASFVLTILVVDRLGWVVAGTVLFWGTVTALGSRHHVRDLVISVLLALATFYGFYAGLGIHLPAGILEGVL